MQVSSTPPAKRARVKDETAAAVAAPRKTRSRKTPAPETAGESPVEIIAMHPTQDELSGMIATTAYFIAAQRNFAPGQELDDWLEAERLVRSQHPG